MTASSSTPVFYTLDEAAAILKVTKRTVQRALHRLGRKPGLLGRPRLSREDLDRLAGVR